jgi:UDP-glucuronate 4-epimerase
MTILVTGAAGFIGFHVCRALLGHGAEVVGIDALTPYYDSRLKAGRLELLREQPAFRFHKADVADRAAIAALCDAEPEVGTVIHLAAQAGVRHSLEDPFSYVTANVMGQMVMLEACRRMARLEHFVYASTSAVYGTNTKSPFAVTDRVDQPVSPYAATKRSAELLAEAHAHLYALPVTGLRFFTVYGPYGRPDMAYYAFTRAIFAGEPIRVFNHGRMKRDFTYIDDVVAGVLGAADRPPAGGGHAIYNLGNDRSETLMRFIEVLENACGREARKEFLPMQPGDVEVTHADIEASRRDFGFNPSITIDEGLPRFVDWFRTYHHV